MFVIGSCSGPLGVRARACTRCHVEIDDAHNPFPPDSIIHSTHTCVDDDIYVVYFDWLLHVQDHDNVAFTDYRTQAQTIKYCIVDIGSPPTGKIMLFNAYIALSCGRGRVNI